ncbi:MAG: hypothetical protein WC477_07480 [Patescibacteria group bacterium]
MEKITIKEPYSSVGGSHEMLVEVADLSQVSDGYHTIAELYDHRIALFIALCLLLKRQENMIGHIPEGESFVWRSKYHSDGELAFGGEWFVLGIGKVKGFQITYHLPISRWDETAFAETLDRAPEWDGHTAADVLERLKQL